MKSLIIITMIGLLTACNTVSGLGKDLTGTADWTKEKISKKEFNQK
jgi:predicted small secreted protein